jgi:uncharacterized protein YhjY with autotransporter beta-barrel domain
MAASALACDFVSRSPDASVRPYGLIAYERELSDDQTVFTNGLPGLGSFRVLGTELGRDIFTARLGATAQLGVVSLFSTIGASMRQNGLSHYAQGGLKVSW